MISFLFYSTNPLCFGAVTNRLRIKNEFAKTRLYQSGTPQGSRRTNKEDNRRAVFGADQFDSGRDTGKGRFIEAAQREDSVTDGRSRYRKSNRGYIGMT